MNSSVILNQHLINSIRSEYNYVEITSGNEQFKIQFKNKLDKNTFENYIFENDKIRLIFDGTICVKIEYAK